MNHKPMEEIRKLSKKPGKILKPRNIEKIPKEVKILALTYFVYTLGSKSVSFFIPVYVENILGNVSLAGIVVSLYGIAMIILDVPVGDLLDRIGRKTLVLTGMLVRGIAGILFFFSTGIEHLILARLTDGTGISFSWDSVWTMVRDKSPKKLESESMALFEMGPVFSSIVGPILGGFLALKVGLRPVFLLFVLLSFTGLLIAYKWVDESFEKKESIEDGVKDVVEKDKIFKKSIVDLENLGYRSLLPLIQILLYGVCLSNIWFIVPLFAKSLGLNLFLTGLLIGAMYMPGIFKYWFSEISDKIGDKKLIFYLSVIGSILILPLIFISDMWILFAVIVPFFTILLGLSPSINALVTKTTPGDEMGELTGLYQNFKHMGMFFGPFIAGFMADYFWISAPFAISTISLLILSIITLWSGFDM
ncbi:MAG: MFS transporter [Candidatus Aenigmatarchaeota archaeon]